MAFDLPGKTFRDDLYEPYKAHRVAAPAELYSQIPRVKELVQTMNLPTFELENYEADDIIGSLATLAKKEKGLEVAILTGDLDTLQLVDGGIKVFAPKKGISETMIYDRKAVNDRYGLDPEQIVDYKALRGDPSDNIPGVKGIGEKTASELLQKYKTLDGIYKALEKGGTDFKPRVAQALNEHRKDAEISRELATIVRNLPIKLDLKKAELADYDEGKVVKMFQELEFRSLIDKLPPSSALRAPSPEQGEGGSETLKSNYELVDSKEKYLKFIKKLVGQSEFALDTETTSIHPVEAELLGIGISWEKDEAFYILKDFVGLELRQILENPKIFKIGHNIKYDYLVLKNAEIELAGIGFDTMIAAYLLNPGARNFDLDTLTFNEFGFRKIPITSLIGEGRKQINMSEVAPGRVAAYCGEDADCTFQLYKKLKPELAKWPDLKKIFYEVEMPLVKILAEMEHWGIKIDPKFLKSLSVEATKEAEKIQGQIWRLAGEEFNIGSPLQLKKILFEKLEIPSSDLKKGKTGLSTAAQELEKLQGLHPEIVLIL